MSKLFFVGSLAAVACGQAYLSDLKQANDQAEKRVAGLQVQLAILEASPKKQMRKVHLTVYSRKYEGRTARNGTTFRHSGLTCAVPRSEYKKLVGKRLTFKVGARSVTCVVTDSCGWIRGREVKNFDLTERAWKKLYPGLAPGREKALMVIE